MFIKLYLLIVSIFMVSCSTVARNQRGIASVISIDTTSQSKMLSQINDDSNSSSVLNVIVNNISEDNSGCFIEALQGKFNELDEQEVELGFVNTIVLDSNFRDHFNVIEPLFELPKGNNMKSTLYVTNSDIGQLAELVSEVKTVDNLGEARTPLYKQSENSSSIHTLNLENLVCSN